MASSPVTGCLRYGFLTRQPTCLSEGRRLATAFQMAPVPPSRGNRNTAFGPHPASSLLSMTLVMARFMSTVATRSPSQSHCIKVVGCAHTCPLPAPFSPAHSQGLSSFASPHLAPCRPFHPAHSQGAFSPLRALFSPAHWYDFFDYAPLSVPQHCEGLFCVALFFPQLIAKKPLWCSVASFTVTTVDHVVVEPRR